jgi:hypothetical protein
MKIQTTLYSALLAGSLIAQTPAPAEPAAPAAPAAVLSPEQKANVLKQLDALEKTIMAQRGTSLGAAIARIRSAASSDAAAMNFLAECDQLVNVEWKDGDRDAKKAAEDREERAKRAQTNADADDVEKQGDTATGVRLALEYLALSLEARDVKNIADMGAKLQGFHQSLISAGPKLHGRTGDMLSRGLAGGGGGGGGARRAGARFGGNGNQVADVGLVIAAYQLDQYLDRKDWAPVPADIVGQYENVFIKPAKDKSKIGALWDTAINTEASYRKARMFEGEFKIWQATEYPELRWRRATSVMNLGGDEKAGLAELFKTLNEFPSHGSAPQWLAELRGLIEASGGSAPAAR